MDLERCNRACRAEARSAKAGAAYDLDAWSSFPWTDGIQVDRLRSLETLEVQTKNTVYEITVMDPRSGEILVRGGKFFPVYTRARLSGASLAGSFLKLLGVYVGFSMEFHTDDGAIVTTRVREITTNRQPRTTN
jgi:hypothetical protein